MTYGDFYDIAELGNNNWRGKFTPKGVAVIAYEYLCEFEVSKERTYPTFVIQELLYLLDEDGSCEALEYANNIRYELGLIMVEK